MQTVEGSVDNGWFEQIGDFQTQCAPYLEQITIENELAEMLDAVNKQTWGSLLHTGAIYNRAKELGFILDDTVGKRYLKGEQGRIFFEKKMKTTSGVWVSTGTKL